MITTIPYDKGWKILVDGVEQPAVKMLDSFIGVRLTPGSHTIEMSYRPEGLDIGLMISIGSAVLLLFIALGGRFWRKYRSEVQDSDTETRQFTIEE